MADDQRLFINEIFNLSSFNDSPSAVYISMPNSPNKSNEAKPDITGLMVGDPTWSAGNTWGPIINDISNLTDVSSLLGESSMFSWISASTMCWKGTNPLGIGVEFYLINYSKNLELEAQLKRFVKLASLYKDPDATAGAAFKVLVHNGYAADIFSSNAQVFDNLDSIRSLEDWTNQSGALGKEFVKDSLQGTVSIQFGHKTKISNLLLSKVSVTESTIEVADQQGGNIKPLYYRVSAQFTGARPLLTTDVDNMFSRYR
jgi:hypothetical protein